MPLGLRTTSPARSLAALGEVIDDAKGDDPLSPVTCIVPSNLVGVMSRRALGRASGLLGVDMVTIGRLAELIAGPVLAAQGRRPMSGPIVELAVRRVLAGDPGSFEPVAEHPTTIDAIRRAHEELRLAGDRAGALASTRRGRELLRVSRGVVRRLSSDWYDDADLFQVATELIGGAGRPPLDPVIVHLPREMPARHVEFLQTLGAHTPTTVVMTLTGESEADRAPLSVLERLGLAGEAATNVDAVVPTVEPAAPRRLISVTDADDEVRHAARAVVSASRGELTGESVPFERIAILWPTHRPYARLVEHHLDRDLIPWNGRGGIELVERIAPRLLLHLLRIDRPALRRSALFELLADVPARDVDAAVHPSASWARYARAAGVTDEWDRALERLVARTEHPDQRDRIRALSAFVTELRHRLDDPTRRRTWEAWAAWSRDAIDWWLGLRAAMRFDDAEYRAWEALIAALDRLGGLDLVDEPVDRAGFASVLESELTDLAVRQGRIGHGVTIGSLASGPGADIDVAIVLGAVDGTLPPTPRPDPLLGDAERRSAAMRTSDDQADDLAHAFAATLQSTAAIVLVPRGDLRATTTHHASRWLVGRVDTTDAVVVASSTAGLRDLTWPGAEHERRLRDRLRLAAGGPLSSHHPGLGDDEELRRSLLLAEHRAHPELTVYDGDLSGVALPTLDDAVVSPTQIETWAACPFQYFVQYLLHVRHDEDAEREITMSPLHAGSLLHEALDRFHRDVLRGEAPSPDDGWTHEHETVLLGHFDDCCDEFERAGRTGRPAVWHGHRTALRHDLLAWLAHDGELLRQRSAHLHASEFSFPTDRDGTPTVADRIALPLPDGRSLAVRGSVDRVDVASDGSIVVTDHKTGRDRYQKLTDDDPTLDGSKFQLPVYAAAARALVGGEGPVRAEYSMFGAGGYARRGVEFGDGVWNEVADRLGHVVDGIEAGWFPLDAPEPGFRLWNECWFCNPDDLSTADIHARWSRKRSDPRVRRWFGPDGERDEPDEATT
ncbi:MAG: PD-(D/E)XK nuclease family protein [Actinomycetota bacterium]